MNKQGEYYSYKNTNYDQALKDCVEETCQYCIDQSLANTDEKINHPIMMLGKIQSGKTRAFTGLIALAFDNDFDIIFILTKNSKALIQQTVSRMKSEFQPFIAKRELIVSDIIKRDQKISGYELQQKNIIVAKKQKQNLDKIINFIVKYGITNQKRCLIIDDEADTTGIGYQKKSGTDEFTLRTVSAKVNELRGTLDGCVFVEVTATPYALYLQPDFQEVEDLHPVKPIKTVLVPHGEEYIGGEYYFLESQNTGHPASFLFQEMSDYEGNLVGDQKRNGKKSKIDDRRCFKVEDILSNSSLVPTFKKGIINFIIGSIVLRDLYNDNQCYSYVIHTAQQKNSHFSLERAVETFLNEIKSGHEPAIVKQLLQDSYDDIQKSMLAYGKTMPSFQFIETNFYKYLDDGYYSIDVVNAEKDVDSLLDDDTGELYLKTPCSIFVGGQVLDRGVTIFNMIGFYYGRSPISMQQDTVLQHSRMFGYRKRMLPVTRFYTTERIHSNMTKITEIDLALRMDIQDGKQGEGVYFITSQRQDNKFGTGKIIPCAPSKISVSDVILLIPHKRLLPVGFSTVTKAAYNNATKKIDSIIGNSNKKETVTLPLEKTEELLQAVYETIKKDDDSSRFINKNEMITSLRYMMGSHADLPVIIVREKKNSKYRQTGRLEDAPDNGQLERKEAISLAKSTPVLILLQEEGDDASWKERPFWWPVLVAPKTVPKTMYAAKTTDKIIHV